MLAHARRVLLHDIVYQCRVVHSAVHGYLQIQQQQVALIVYYVHQCYHKERLIQNLCQMNIISNPPHLQSHSDYRWCS